MPSYSFQCDHCGKDFSKHFHIGEDHSGVSCPRCGQDALHRVYFPPSIEFRSSGFYVTDNQKKNDKPKVS